MTDYIAWLLDEDVEDAEEETKAPAPRLRTVRPLRQGAASVEEDTEGETVPKERQSAPFQGRKALEAALLARTRPAEAETAVKTAEGADTAPSAFRRASHARARALTVGHAPDAAAERAASALYARLTEGRRQASVAQAPPADARLALPERAEVSAPPVLDIAALDRCFERDARRYDSQPVF